MFISNFIYYDRKEDEDLSENKLDEAIKNGDVTIDEMVDRFKTNLEKYKNQPQQWKLKNK